MNTIAADSVLAAGMPGEYGFIGWIIIGGLAGWIASKFMGTDKQMGILLNILVGVVGAFIGGLILGLIIDTDNFGWILTFITSVVGACILLFVVKLFRKQKTG